MSSAQALVRRRERIGELCGATARALVGDSLLQFRGQRLHRGRRPLPLFAPHLHPSFDRDDFRSFRGAIDGIASRLTHSDPKLHAALCPIAPVERLLFDLLEQFRVESLAQLPGVVHNLRHRFEAWSLDFHHGGSTDSARGILLFTVAQVCRARVTNEPVPEEIADLLEATRAGIAAIIGHDLVGLRRHRTGQSAYAVHALAIANAIGALVDWDEKREPGGDDDGRERAAFALVMDIDRLASEQFATAVSGRSRVLDEADGGYRVFTRAHDRQVDAGRLARSEVLQEHRRRLDARIAGQNISVARLARELRILLGTPTRDGWDGGADEGTIDGRRLARLVATPTERRIFRNERDEPVADCVVGFLIDCSGSMKEHAESVATLVDVFARSLEQAGVASEVLGFTTGAWNGGRARRDWQRAGMPPHPGRLNEVRHIVFKDADTSWRRARPHVAALLKEDLFREGIDGEAVDWACGRLRGRAEQRKLLLVISDGSPMDTATNLANDAHYLDHHLRDVVFRQERIGGIEIYGVGVGLDLSPYYSRSHVLDLAGASGHQSFHEIIAMIGSRRRRIAVEGI